MPDKEAMERAYQWQGLRRGSDLDRSSEECVILLVVCSDLVLSTVWGPHHECLIGISSYEIAVGGSDVELAEGVDVGLEAIGLVCMVAEDRDTSSRHGGIAGIIRMRGYGV